MVFTGQGGIEDGGGETHETGPGGGVVWSRSKDLGASLYDAPMMHLG